MNKRVLQFSGGKDSLACLLLLKHELDDITVLWCDAGDSFPETLAQMETIKAMCPNFVVVKGRQPEQVQMNGYPVDVLPIRNHPTIQGLVGQKRIKLQGFIECCSESFWKPMNDATKELGATTIIRGQKLVDVDKGSVRNGDVVDGIAFEFPLEAWTDEEVLAYVKPSGLLPDYYDVVKTSLDCMHCTAYLAANQGKLKYTNDKHPEVGKEISRRFGVISTEINRDMKYLETQNG